MNVLITGGAGFIGACTARKFIQAGHAVTILDNFETGERSNVPVEAQVITADVRDAAAVRSACRGRDAIVHLAAMVSVARSFAEPGPCHSVNVFGTRHVLEAAHAAGVKRIALASSAAVYGNVEASPKREDALPQPTSPYALTKWTNEVDAAYFGEYLDTETVCLRFFNVYGPKQRANSPYSDVLSLAARRILAGEPFTVFGDGLQTRDFIYVEDVAAALLAATTREGLRHEIMNVGSGVSMTLLEMLATLETVIGRKGTLQFGPARIGDIRHSLADVTRMHERLGQVPATRLAQGLAETIGWLTAS